VPTSAIDLEGGPGDHVLRVAGCFDEPVAELLVLLLRELHHTDPAVVTVDLRGVSSFEVPGVRKMAMWIRTSEGSCHDVVIRAARGPSAHLLLAATLQDS
jgi:hypothetical protein